MRHKPPRDDSAIFRRREAVYRADQRGSRFLLRLVAPFATVVFLAVKLSGLLPVRWPETLAGPLIAFAFGLLWRGSGELGWRMFRRDFSRRTNQPLPQPGDA